MPLTFKELSASLNNHFDTTTSEENIRPRFTDDEFFEDLLSYNDINDDGFSSATEEETVSKFSDGEEGFSPQLPLESFFPDSPSLFPTHVNPPSTIYGSHPASPVFDIDLRINTVLNDSKEQVVPEVQPSKTDAKTNKQKRDKIDEEEKHPLIRKFCCKKKSCCQRISEFRQIDIHDGFWSKDWTGRREFIMQRVTQGGKKRSRLRNFEGGNRSCSRAYSFIDEIGEIVDVCQRFFLNVLGYKRTIYIPYSRRLWCMHLCTKPRDWCMHQKRVQNALFFYLKKIGLFRI